MTDKLNLIDFTRYECCADGSIASAHGFLAGWTNRDGYRCVKLKCVDGKYRNFLWHRVIGLQFVPNPDRLPEINHKDADKQNNAASNLEWVSHKENCNHRDELGLIKDRARGKKNGNSRFTEADILDIRWLASQRVGQRAIAESFNTDQQYISMIVREKVWAHV